MSRKRILRHSAARWHQARSRLLLKVVILVAACSTEHDSREPMGTETSALAAPTFPSDLSFPASSIVPVNTRSSSDPTTIGATSSSSEVSSDGEASVAIPLWVSPGRADIQPSLGLLYGSRAGDGVLGYGWTLDGVAEISRCGPTYARDGQKGNVDFAVRGDWPASAQYLCLNGQRLILASGSYWGATGVYRVEQDGFVRIRTTATDALGPLSFEADLPDGRIIEFSTRFEGTASATYDVSIAADKTVRFKWLQSGLRDRSGNSVVYNYRWISQSKSTGYELVLDNIAYTKTCGGRRGTSENGQLLLREPDRPCVASTSLVFWFERLSA